MHQIPTLKLFTFRLAVISAQSTETRCWEWRCRWSSADRRCCNYIWVINNLSPTEVPLILEVWRYIHPMKYAHLSCFVVFLHVSVRFICPYSSGLLIWTIWTSLSAVPRKAVKFNHSLTHFRVTSLALGQSWDCPSASEVILKNMGYQCSTGPQRNKIQWN